MAKTSSTPVTADRPVTAAIVGAGHRSVGYAEYAIQHPDELKIVAVADPREFRRREVAARHNIPENMLFETAEQLAAHPKVADAVINGTIDKDHVPTALPLLKAGYHMLLEKPISTYESEVLDLLKVARETDRIVMICHVLRYAPFYAAIRQRIIDGEVGDIVNIQTCESVSYHHIAMGYVRGKWNRKDLGNYSTLSAKCCHDLDIVAWMKSGITPKSVSSFGGLMQYKPQNAPEGSGMRCLVDCKIEKDCCYSAYKNYIEHDWWEEYAFDCIDYMKPTVEQKIESLKGNDNPYGRCVWQCDNDVVDHQSVVIEFEDGSTATHTLIGGTSKPTRTIHIIGTKGEIQGVQTDAKFVIRHPDCRPDHEYSEELIDLQCGTDMHGGGDLRLVEDFVKSVRGTSTSISNTNLEDSINGHRIVFAADNSMEQHRPIEID
jgi:predicted dehydrogenase